METNAKKKARATYEKKNSIVTVQMRVPAWERAQWKKQAAENGETLTGYIRKLLASASST